MQKQFRKYAEGQAIIQTLAVIFVALIFSVLAVDFAFYYTAQNQLQTAANAGALAGASRLIHTDSSAPEEIQGDVEIDAETFAQENAQFTVVNPEDVIMGYYDFEDGSGFSTSPSVSEFSFSGGYNAVKVTAWADDEHSASPLPTIMANLLGINSMGTVAAGTAALNDKVAVVKSGLRPVYACQTQWNIANADGNLSNDTARIYGDRFSLNGNTATCPIPGPGNWGFADLRDCGPGSPGASTIGDWFADGYPGTVESGECYSTNPGNFLSSNGVQSALNRLIADETVVILPVIDTFNGSGSNTSVGISSFTGFVFTGYKANGPADQRYIEGYFTRAICTENCTTDNTIDGTGVYKLRLVKN